MLDKNDNIKVKKQKKKNTVLFNKINKKYLIIIFILLFLFYLMYINRRLDINKDTNMYRVNVNKQYSEILENYNKEESKNIFIQEISKVQSLVGKYFVNNTNIENNNFKNLIKYVNNEINKDNFGGLKGEKNTFFVGSYNVDDNGKVKFKFKTKEIEPNWIDEIEDIERN